MEEATWYRAAAEAGWTDIEPAMKAVQALAARLDGPYADPLGYCRRCGTPLFDGTYQRWATGPEFEDINLESWGMKDAATGELQCLPSCCDKSALRERLGIKAVPSTATLLIRRLP